jgi:predicted aldo/keto reductase-like oxidoreductase
VRSVFSCSSDWAFASANSCRIASGPDYPIHLFDEPQFNAQDGCIGFMLDFVRRLRREGRLVFLCLHPHERYQLDIMREICERYRFGFQSRVSWAPDLRACSPSSACAATWAI